MVPEQTTNVLIKMRTRSFFHRTNLVMGEPFLVPFFNVDFRQRTLIFGELMFRYEGTKDDKKNEWGTLMQLKEILNLYPQRCIYNINIY